MAKGKKAKWKERYSPPAMTFRQRRDWINHGINSLLRRGQVEVPSMVAAEIAETAEEELGLVVKPYASLRTGFSMLYRRY